MKDPPEKAKWLAITRVSKGFNPSALCGDMGLPWNPAKEVRWRKIDDNLFTVQYEFLSDWNNTLRNQIEQSNVSRTMVISVLSAIEEYDRFQNPRTMALDKLVLWSQVLRLPDNYLPEPIIKGMCRPMGPILEVQITLLAGFVGEFVRIQPKIDLNKKITKFLSITKD